MDQQPCTEQEINNQDVLLGKQTACTNHVGNIAFRILIVLHARAYEAQSRREDKTHFIHRIANQIVRQAQGRFLQRQDSIRKCDGVTSMVLWYPVTQKEIYDKIGTAFRDELKAINADTKRRAASVLQTVLDYYLKREERDRTSCTFSHVLNQVVEESRLENSRADVLDTMLVVSRPREAELNPSVRSSSLHPVNFPNSIPTDSAIAAYFERMPTAADLVLDYHNNNDIHDTKVTAQTSRKIPETQIASAILPSVPIAQILVETHNPTERTIPTVVSVPSDVRHLPDDRLSVDNLGPGGLNKDTAAMNEDAAMKDDDDIVATTENDDYGVTGMDDFLEDISEFGREHGGDFDR